MLTMLQRVRAMLEAERRPGPARFPAARAADFRRGRVCRDVQVRPAHRFKLIARLRSWRASRRRAGDSAASRAPGATGTGGASPAASRKSSRRCRSGSCRSYGAGTRPSSTKEAAARASRFYPALPSTCGSAMKRDPHVDHFIPWSRCPRDLGRSTRRDAGGALGLPASRGPVGAALGEPEIHREYRSAVSGDTGWVVELPNARLDDLPGC